MKAKKKPHRIKRKTRGKMKREERLGLAVKLAIIITIISVSGFIINSMLISSRQEHEPSSTAELNAAIVDHLSLTYPNQTFIQTATNTLEQVGYTVDYYPGEEVTVELYRNLPTHNYQIILLRVHSCIARGSTELDLFTSESYSPTKYLYEQLTNRVSQAFSLVGGPTYFAITPSFIKFDLNGRFGNTLIIMMGCNGLTYTGTAQAFIERGAKVYIGWNKPVLASHTDLATINLLQHLLIEKMTVEKAIQETFEDVGADPTYDSILLAYPEEAMDYAIQNITANSETVNVQDVLRDRRKEWLYG